MITLGIKTAGIDVQLCEVGEAIQEVSVVYYNKLYIYNLYL